MSRRKDNKGRVLRTGESQRKDLIYQYRYTDALGNRKCIYASDLKILREKEDELQRSLEEVSTMQVAKLRYTNCCNAIFR